MAAIGKRAEYRWAVCVLDWIFLVLVGVYLFQTASSDTLFHLPFPSWTEDVLLWSLAGIAVIRLIFIGFRSKEIWLCLLLAAFYVVLYFFHPENYRFLLLYAAISAGCYQMEYRKVLKTYLLSAGLLLLITIMAGLSGAIPDLLYMKSGAIRSALGVIYPTDMASKVLFALLIVWAAKKKLPEWVMIILCAGSGFISYYFARSSTSFLCSILLLLAILYLLAEEHLIAKRKGLYWIRKTVSWILTLLLPALAVLFFLLMLLYMQGYSIGIRINEFLSNRLMLAAQALEQYGVHLVGTPFQMVGYGSSTIPSYGYNMVDNSYALLLVRYGLLFLLVICALWIWLVRKAIRNGHLRVALVMGIIAVHSFSEHHFAGISYNIFLVMPFAAFPAVKEDAAEEKKPFCCIAAILTGVIGIAAAICLAPFLFTRLRTVFQICGLTGSEGNGWFIILILFGVLLLVFLAVWVVWKIVSRIINKKKLPYIRVILAVLVCACVTVGALIYTAQLIDKALQDNTEMIEADRDALEIITKAATGGVYTDLLPDVYQRVYPQMKDTVLSGEELARIGGNTVLMDVDTEYNVLFWAGYLFVPISDSHAVYTDDLDVAVALGEAGYPQNWYYDRVTEEDMTTMAAWNGLPWSEEEGITTDGPDRSIAYGPYEDLFAGVYSVTYELSIPVDSILDERSVCTLMVTSYWGQEVLAEQELLRSQFKEDGRLTVTLPFYTWTGVRNVEFKVFTAEGEQVQVHGIRYGKTMDYQIHME